MTNAAVVETPSYEDGDLIYAALNEIEEIEGHNPRIYFDDAKQRELEASIKQHGVNQPVVIRPLDSGKFAIIAGHRRFRASKNIGLNEMPAILRLVDEKQANAIALAENTIRDDMSPTEEAKAARKVLDSVDGDRAEAIKLLGWSDKKLDARLLLLHASAKVLNALMHRQIKLGHAELLSGIPEQTQDGTVDKIIEEGWSVEFLKTKINAFASDRPLSGAIFDTSDCVSCPYNSDTQGNLFEEAISGGLCGNAECFAGKVKGALEAKKAEKAEEYPVIFLDVEKDPTSYTLLMKKEVGDNQFTACKGCGSFGVVMDTTPGKEGQIIDDVCFDLSCHKKKKAEHAEAMALKPVASTTDNKVAPKNNKAKTTSKSTVSTASTPKNVIEQSDKFVREVGCEIVTKDQDLGLCFAVYMLFEKVSKRDVEGVPESVTAVLKKHSQENKAIEHLYPINRDDLNKAIVALSAYYVNSDHRRMTTGTSECANASAVIRATGTELAGRFKLTREYLEAHTKKGIEALLAEAGFDKWYCEKEKNPAAMKKLVGKKTDEIIKTILGSEFDFSTFVPNAIKERLKKGG